MVRRALRLRFSPIGLGIASASVALLAILPFRLRIGQTDSGTDELALYAAWWLLSGMILSAIFAIRWHARRAPARSVPSGSDETPSQPSALVTELPFLAMTFAAVAVHLYGMNYAFFGHARLFYAAPALIALMPLGLELVTRVWRRPEALVSLACLPAAALLLGRGEFAVEVGAEQWPRALQQPWESLLLFAALAWWFAHARLRWSVLLHAGSVAAGTAVFQIVDWSAVLPDHWCDALRPDAGADAAAFALSRGAATLAAYGITLYLLVSAIVRRSRVDAVAALAANVVATVLLAWQRTPADNLILVAVFGWSALIAVHVLSARPRWMQVAAPIVFLVVSACALDVVGGPVWLTRMHAGFIVVVLAIAGRFWPTARYTIFAAGSVVVFAAFYTARGLASSRNGESALAIFAAFALLAAGATISWFKQDLLRLTRSVRRATEKQDRRG